jgi:protein-tyrosine phosphatase
MSKSWHGRESGDFWDDVQSAVKRSEARGDGGVHYHPPTEVKVIDCHKPPPQDVGHHVYACASMDVARAIEHVTPRLILDCRNLSTTQLTVVPVAELLTAGPRSLRRVVARHLPPPPSIVRIAWPDFGLPPLGPRFFIDVARWLSGRPVLCVCMGGHGRSGTAAASILAGYGLTYDAAVSAVRQKHCKLAIEGAKQLDFVRRVADARRKGR